MLTHEHELQIEHDRRNRLRAAARHALVRKALSGRPEGSAVHDKVLIRLGRWMVAEGRRLQERHSARRSELQNGLDGLSESLSSLADSGGSMLTVR